MSYTGLMPASLSAYVFDEPPKETEGVLCMKILLVNSIANYSVNDVFVGYERAFKKLGIRFDAYDWANQRRLLSDEVCARMVHSYLNETDRWYSHVLFINGYEIPDFVLKSCPKQTKKILYSVDDPWSGWGWKYREHLYDMIFSQEIEVSKKFDSINYLPVGWDSLMEIPPVDRGLESDVCFLGTLYPNRFLFLLELVPELIKHKIKFIGAGPVPISINLSQVPAWWNNTLLSHYDYLAYQRATAISLNLNRRHDWQADAIAGVKSITESADSLNPRAYENAGLSVFTLSDDTRIELNQIIPDCPTFTDVKDCLAKIQYYLDNYDKRRRCIEAARQTAQNHTYERRANKLIWCLQQGA